MNGPSSRPGWPGDLRGSATLLGTFWAIFGVGAIVGGLAAPYLRRLPTWPVMTAIVLGWGVALLPLGLRSPRSCSAW